MAFALWCSSPDSSVGFCNIPLFCPSLHMGAPRIPPLMLFSHSYQGHPSHLHGFHYSFSYSLFSFSFHFKKIYLFLAVLSLHCCTQTFSSCVKQGLLSSFGTGVSDCGGFSCCGVWALEHAVFSNCNSQALEQEFSSCGTQVQLPHGMWDLPRPEIEPVCPVLWGGFLTTGPPGKPHHYSYLPTGPFWVLSSELIFSTTCWACVFGC